MCDRSFAGSGTQLLDPRGTTWLQGSTLWVTLAAGGTLLVQGEPGAGRGRCRVGGWGRRRRCALPLALQPQ